MNFTIETHVLLTNALANLPGRVVSLLTTTGNQFIMFLEGPRSCSDAKSVALQESLDVSPIQLNEIQISGGKLIPTPPLVYHPVLNRKYLVLEISDSLLNIDAYGYNRDELIKSIEIELDVLWRNYAMADDSTLDPGAIELKNALEHRFRHQ